MTDRELLELAAKAAGLIIRWSDSWGCYQRFVGPVDEPMSDWLTWRPLTDDGDALRLAVMLRLNLHYGHKGEGPIHCGQYAKDGVTEWGSSDAENARRAITRAAAEIGRSML